MKLHWYWLWFLILIICCFYLFTVTTFKQQQFRVQPKDVYAKEGSNVTLNCEINDITGDVQWTKDGLALGTSIILCENTLRGVWKRGRLIDSFIPRRIISCWRERERERKAQKWRENSLKPRRFALIQGITVARNHEPWNVYPCFIYYHVLRI